MALIVATGNDLTSAARQLAQLLEANSAPGSNSDHSAFLEGKYTELVQSAETRGYNGEVANAVLNYVMNHHYFDCDTHQRVGALIDAAFELACPLAADDDRSQDCLAYVAQRIEGTKNDL